jgi:hypothetical protein
MYSSKAVNNKIFVLGENLGKSDSRKIGASSLLNSYMMS